MKPPFKYPCNKVTIRPFFGFVGLWICGLSTLHLKGESLWLQNTNNERGIFADRTACKRGDLVTVLIDEKIVNRAGVTTEDQHKSKYAFTQKVLDEVRRHGGPKISLPVPYEPLGGIDMKTTLTMQVIDVLPNGNLILEGVRKERIFDTYQYQVARGIARKEDLTDSNAIDSAKLANFTIEHSTGTSIEDARRDGLLTKFNNFVKFY